MWCVLAGIGLLAVLFAAWAWWEYRRMLKAAQREFEV